MIVFSVDNQNSCEEALRLVDEIIEIKQHAIGNGGGGKNQESHGLQRKFTQNAASHRSAPKIANSTPILLVANKTDLEDHKKQVK